MSPLFFLVPTLMFFFTPLVQSALLLICQMLIPYIVLSFTQMQVIKQGCQPVEPKLEVQLGSNKNDFFLPNQKIQAQSEPSSLIKSSWFTLFFLFFIKNVVLQAVTIVCKRQQCSKQFPTTFFFKKGQHITGRKRLARAWLDTPKWGSP